ncbi:MAG: glycosyltransferase [Gammaproteobacteria bacterium]|nr:glycosyltransferase [Gammaproteobacteria bacterium]
MGSIEKHSVVFLITGLSTGGAERALYNLLHGGLISHFDNHVISLSDEGTMGPQIRAIGVPVTTLGMRGGRPSLHGLIKLRRVVREIQPEIIQGWMYHGNLAATLARTLASGHPVLAWNVRHSLYELNHEKPMTQHVIRVNRFFSSAPDVLLYNSQLSRKQHEDFGFASLNGRVIPNGIDVQSFCFSGEARKRVRSELGIPAEAQVVGHVARLHPMKDHPAFLRVAAGLALRYPELHFLLSGRDVSLENTTLQQLLPIQVRDRFHLLDERGDVSELMSAMDVFCLSSAWGEGFPNVIGEAMATEVPCVATDVGDSANIIGDTGVVIPPCDEDALATGIESLLTMPLEERRALGAKARDRVETNYTLAAIVDQYASLYEKLMAEKGVR